MLTLTRNVLPYRVGETEWFYADFDPPNMPAADSLLDGRTIESATAALEAGASGTIDQVSVVGGAGETVGGVLIAAGTGVKFRASGLQPRSDCREVVVNVVATLDDGSVKPLGVRIAVER